MGEHWSNILESFNSDLVMTVNGQRKTAFVNDCLCGIKAITQYVSKVCSQADLYPDIEFLLHLYALLPSHYNVS